MKRKALEQLKEKSAETLLKSANDLTQEILKAKAEFLTGREKNVRKVKNMRIERATMLTLIQEKEMKGAK